MKIYFCVLLTQNTLFHKFCKILSSLVDLDCVWVPSHADGSGPVQHVILREVLHQRPSGTAGRRLGLHRYYNRQDSTELAMATFWRTFHHNGWYFGPLGGTQPALPFSLYLPPQLELRLGKLIYFAWLRLQENTYVDQAQFFVKLSPGVESMMGSYYTKTLSCFPVPFTVLGIVSVLFPCTFYRPRYCICAVSLYLLPS